MSNTLREKIQAQFADLALSLENVKRAPITQLRAAAGDLAFRQSAVLSTMAAALLDQEQKIETLMTLAKGDVPHG